MSNTMQLAAKFVCSACKPIGNSMQYLAFNKSKLLGKP